MLKNRTTWFMMAVMAFMLIFTVIVYPSLPDELPVHWGFDGQVNHTMPKAQAVLVIPGIGILLFGIMHIVPKVDPRRENYEKFASSYLRLREAAIVFIAAMHVMLLTNYDNPKAMVKLALFAAALFFAVIGNEAGRFKQTWFTGFRTPWTLSDERVWRQTHRVGARWMVGTGIANMLLLLLLPLSLAGIFFMASVIGVSSGIVVYSYVLYQRLNG